MTFAVAAAARLTVLRVVVVIVLMVVCLFSGRVEKNVLAGWCLGFVLLLFFSFLSLQCACLKKKKNATASGSEDFFCDHLD